MVLSKQFVRSATCEGMAAEDGRIAPFPPPIQSGQGNQKVSIASPQRWKSVIRVALPKARSHLFRHTPTEALEPCVVTIECDPFTA